MDNLFRTLRSDEIECRVGQSGSNWCTLLLYKDARVDMDLLDEVIGPYNWKREHSRDNANCVVSIFDKEKKEWISKEDVGSESNTEKEKGLASDSFKRACVNWGIGRELYTAPVIWITLNNDEVEKDNNGKIRLKIFKGHFHVDAISYDDNRNIKSLVIKDKFGVVRFSTNGAAAKPATKPAAKPAPKQEPAAAAPQQAPANPEMSREEKLTFVREKLTENTKMFAYYQKQLPHYSSVEDFKESDLLAIFYDDAFQKKYVNQ